MVLRGTASLALEKNGPLFSRRAFFFFFFKLLLRWVILWCALPQVVAGTDGDE